MEEEITALLESIAGGRRYWVRAPQNAARPFVVMHRIDGIRGYTYAGSDGLVSSRVQANCFGNTYTEAKDTARALVGLLDGYTGGAMTGGVIHAVFIESDGRDLAATDAGEVNRLFAIAVDFIAHHDS
jgi:hypothetical protein